MGNMNIDVSNMNDMNMADPTMMPNDTQKMALSNMISSPYWLFLRKQKNIK
jgi:hypothetical protein